MSRSCINWITAKIYPEIFAESLQVMNIEEHIDPLSAHCHSYVLSVKAKIYSYFSSLFSISFVFAGKFNFSLRLELYWEKNPVHNMTPFFESFMSSWHDEGLKINFVQLLLL